MLVSHVSWIYESVFSVVVKILLTLLEFLVGLPIYVGEVEVNSHSQQQYLKNYSKRVKEDILYSGTIYRDRQLCARNGGCPNWCIVSHSILTTSKLY